METDIFHPNCSRSKKESAWQFQSAILYIRGKILELPFEIMCKKSFIFSVYASNTIGTVVVSSTQSVTVDHPTLPLKVSCPTVAAPDIPYR